MNRLSVFVCTLVVCCPGAFAGQTVAQPSPAEQRIAAARHQIAADAKRPQAYDELALAYIRRARETADPVFLNDAETALAKGLRVAPEDFELRKTSVALLLGRQRFSEAREQAAALHAKNPDDITLRGYLAEADLHLGNYDAADAEAQSMLDLRPNNIPGLLLGADLRVHYGDASGALEFLNQALGETPPIEPEEQSSIANRIAVVELDEGKLPAAAQALKRAEALFPGSPVTRANLARLQTARLKTAQAQPTQLDLPKPVAPAPADIRPIEPAAIAVQLTHDPGGVPTALLIPRPTGTARVVRRMQARVEAEPKAPGGYAGLGAALLQRARETGDVEDYQLAEQALTKSLDLVSTDLSSAGALATEAEVCMGEHRFADALDYAQKALALGSGDLSPFGIVGDAYADIGEYEKAGAAYARMVPATGGAPGESDARTAYAQEARTAYLSFISGDAPGAVRQMQAALGEAVRAQVEGENLAWLYFELGEFRYQAGEVQQAADAYLTALNVYPGDYRALAGLAKVRAAQGKYPEAVTLYQSAIAVVPMPLYVAELGDVYARSGNAAEAEKRYKLVEYIGLLGHINQVLHNRDLALFYADHDRNLAEALRLARKEFEVRGDIYTWDALAWALYKNGKYPDAQEAMAHTLRLGTQDPTLLFHAGMIAAKAGQPAEAARRIEAAVKINPRFSVLHADAAARELDALRGQTASAGSGHAR